MMNPSLLLSKFPFIVAGRHSQQLYDELQKNDDPILLEGLHSCFLLTELEKNGLKDRTILVRSHNIEHDYYAQLAQVEKNPFKRFYFKQEAKKLARFEKKYYPLAKLILGISEKDTQYLNTEYGHAKKLSAFHEFDEFSIDFTKGNFACYHGNLSVGENDQAAQFLVEEVFKHSPIKLVIAGSNPSDTLREKCEEASNVELKENITSDEILSLVRNAQMNVLPTFQATGIKLKLLTALYCGKHIVVNSQMVQGTGLESLCHVATTAQEMKTMIDNLAQQEFDKTEIQKRTEAMNEFSNQFNASLLIQYLEGLA